MSLIEVLVSLAIFLIATTFLAYTITASIRHNFVNSLRDKATTVLNNKINELKAISYDNLTNNVSTYNYFFGNDDADNITYTINSYVDELKIGAENSSSNVKRIRINVEWFKPFSKDPNTRTADNISAVFYKTKGE
jgi:Tfp pilus assembly protein PilV